ncbi:MAG: mannose-1-phosphate guanylyltransferase [Gemmatimonadales bacterium]
MSRWAAILAGGSGTRFWPLSTPTNPKQLLPLVGGDSLLELTVRRLAGLIPPERTLVLTGSPLANRTRQLLPDIPPNNIMIEPRAASTAPALTWATHEAATADASATLLSLHADWYIGDDELFRTTASRAMDVAEQHDMMVAVGMVPSRPDTGYGYIQPGDALEGDARRVQAFLEKPDRETASKLIDGGALWNSGLFAWTAKRFALETETVAHEIAPHVHFLAAGDVNAFFESVSPVAVDVSHFERSNRVACIAGSYAWDDVGTWDALARLRKNMEGGNVIAGRVYQRDSQNCIIWAEHGAVVVDGVEDLVVVSAHGVTLVTTRARSAQLKTLLQDMPDSIRKPEE